MNEDKDQKFLDGQRKTSYLIGEIKLYALSLDALREANQTVMEAKPEGPEDLRNMLMFPWYDIVSRFHDIHEEMMAVLQKKNEEFYEHYNPFRQWAEDSGFILPENGDWPDILLDSAKDGN